MRQQRVEVLEVEVRQRNAAGILRIHNSRSIQTSARLGKCKAIG
jgi:hypothetical protein